MPCLFILTEYANGGNLEEFLENLKSEYRPEYSDNRKNRRKIVIQDSIEDSASKNFETKANHTTHKDYLSFSQIKSFMVDICQD